MFRVELIHSRVGNLDFLFVWYLGAQSLVMSYALSYSLMPTIEQFDQGSWEKFPLIEWTGLEGPSKTAGSIGMAGENSWWGSEQNLASSRGS